LSESRASKSGNPMSVARSNHIPVPWRGRSSSAFTDCRDSDLSRRQNRWWCRDGRPKIALAFQPLKGLLDLGFGLWDPNWRLICGSRGSPEFGANFWRQPPFELIVEEGNERTRVTSFDPDPHTELGICRIPALAGLIRPCTGEAEIPSRRNNETARHHFPGGRTDRRANGFLGPAVRARSRGSKASQFCLSSGTDPPLVNRLFPRAPIAKWVLIQADTQRSPSRERSESRFVRDLKRANLVR
jgi:hypothetical protein